MASIGRLVIDLVASTGSFETDMGRAAKAADKRAKEIERSFSNLGKKIGIGIGVGIGLAGVALKKVIDATTQAEDALAKLDNAVRNNAGAAGATTRELVDFSSELQRLTTYGDDTIQEMQALLLTFRQIGGSEFKRSQVAVLDLATSLGTDLKSAALLVGKALADPVRGMTQLQRSGVVLEQSQKDLIKRLVETGDIAGAQGILLKELESRFGGAANAARNTFGGAIKSLQNAFGDLLENKGGLDGSITALNEFTDLLQSPETIQAADTLTSALVKGFSAVFETISTVVGVTKFLGEELAARLNGPAIDDVVRMSDELDRLQKIMNSDPLTDSDWLNRIRLFGDDGLIEWWSDDELRARMAQLKTNIEAALNPAPAAKPGSSGPSAGTAIPLPPSEDFVKISSKLQEQIALYGKVGEAAKIAYAIQSGSLEGLSSAEEKELLSLARRYDAIVENAGVQKEAAAAQQRARESIEQMTTGLQQQVDTLGLSDAETLRYRITTGDLADTFKKAGVNAQEYANKLIALTEQQEKQKQAAEAAAAQAKKFDDSLSRGDAITQSVRTAGEEYADTLKELNTLLFEGAISQETYSRALEKAQEQLDEATNKWTVFKDQAARNTQDIIADTLVNGFDKGAKGIIKAFADMIVQLTAQAVAADIAGKLFGKSGGGEGAGLIGAIAGFFGGGRATGGPVTGGTLYRVNEREPEFFRPRTNGDVIPLSKMPSLGNTSITVNVATNERGGFSMQTRQQLMTDLSVAVARGQRGR